MSGSRVSRRRFLRVLGATAVVGSLYACGRGPTPGGSPAPTPSIRPAPTVPTTPISVFPTAVPTAAASAAPTAPVSGGRVTGEIEFSYYNWGPASIQYFKEMAAAFMKEYPGTRIRLTLPPGDQYTTKLKILLATGTGPDIITTTDITYKLFKEGRLLDLTARVEADPILLDGSKFIQAGWDIYRFGTGHIYGLYSGADTHLLYYNRDLFDKAGVKYPGADWTWDDFVDAAKELTLRKGEKVVQFGTALGILVAYWGWANLVWMEGGDIVDRRPFYSRLTLNNLPVLKVLQFIQDLMYKYKVAPTPEQASALGEAGSFESGKVAMLLDGGWSIQSRKAIKAFRWDVQMMPRGPKGFIGAFWPGTPMQINARTRNPDLCWEFVRWFAASKEAQTLIAKQLIQVPARLDVAFSSVFLRQPGMPPHGDVWVKSLERARPADIQHPNQQEMMDKVWNPNWDKFIRNRMTPQEFAVTVERDGNKVLQSG
ncbi:extracellular solute-binding protein family 1 [Thermobaculum terrenum ATCC BAA-798]|uniref:Extracellular solute-binding protein family 1 n=1 Tax=Thermobaculum terrenum (strain ATCC BAA-798 / CCMEE 7001 / YNP1) TaxID=525904 RepID=D1CI42_THET1|nr:sugar ABC transporter substrate-binding protein [Thermobaculum terrenum]ACZ43413.1 extracellular solute-binding protein family 1 [Thermobaculum terrenum ATCC BAA-798]